MARNSLKWHKSNKMFHVEHFVKQTSGLSVPLRPSNIQASRLITYKQLSSKKTNLNVPRGTL